MRDISPESSTLRTAVARGRLEVSQLGKTCHAPCAIYRQAGECVMTTEGIFSRVVTGGTIRPGDPVRVGATASSSEKR